MRSPELALLDSVTPDEFADAKNAVSEWGSSNFTLAMMVEEIEKIATQIKYVESLVANGAVNIEEAEKTREILEMRKNKLIDVEGKTALRTVIIDTYISELDMLEQNILRMVYQKRLGFEFVSIKNHISRATCFRKRNAALKKIALLMRKEKKVKKDVC